MSFFSSVLPGGAAVSPSCPYDDIVVWSTEACEGRVHDADEDAPVVCVDSYEVR